MHEVFALTFVRVCRIMIVEVIKQLDAAIKTVEEATTEAKAFVQEAYRGDDGRAKDVFQPFKPGIRYGYAQEENQMFDAAVGRCYLLGGVLEEEVVRLWIVYLMSCAFGPGIYSKKGDVCAKSSED